MRRRRAWGLWGPLVVVLALVALPVGCQVAVRSTEQVRTITVAEKAPSTDSKPYRVFTTDGDTYAVKDSLTYFNWRSSDRYGALRVGHTYRCTTAGWRFGPTSSYRNLLECTEVAQ